MTEARRPTQSKEELELELLRHQVTAASAEARRQTRPWWRTVAAYATLISGICTPVALAAWSIVTGLWRAPIDDAQLLSREQSFSARQSLLELQEARLAFEIRRHNQRREIFRIREKEWPEYAAALESIHTYTPNLRFWDKMLIGHQQGSLPEEAVKQALPVDESLRMLLTRELRTLRYGPEGPHPATDRIAQLLTTRSKLARQVAAAFPDSSPDWLPFRRPIIEPMTKPLPDGTAEEVLVAVSRQFAQHEMFVDGLRQEAKEFESWARDLLR